MYDKTTVAWKLLSEQDIVNTNPNCLAPSRKAWRTTLLGYGKTPNVKVLIKRAGLR